MPGVFAPVAQEDLAGHAGGRRLPHHDRDSPSASAGLHPSTRRAFRRAPPARNDVAPKHRPKSLPSPATGVADVHPPGAARTARAGPRGSSPSGDPRVAAGRKGRGP
jgi:hypothetical protein